MMRTNRLKPHSVTFEILTQLKIVHFRSIEFSLQGKVLLYVYFLRSVPQLSDNKAHHNTQEKKKTTNLMP